MFRQKFRDVPRYIQERENFLFKSDIVNYPMWPHEMNSGDGDLPFYDCTIRIQDNYMRKFRFLDDRIRKGDFTQP